MRTVNYSEARQNLADVLESAVTGVPVTITVVGINLQSSLVQKSLNATRRPEWMMSSRLSWRFMVMRSGSLRINDAADYLSGRDNTVFTTGCSASRLALPVCPIRGVPKR
ncbi:prevent host death protein, Phd antitoxin [Klebsiella pneumoniae]|uniref:Prevent host death protein, Phd antitoxin n=1 Tax=Klebsiella pneumoniae TaxID=573 RepID=A0A378FRU7_KLEPN|nr:prevent host death protein, Phd antitoxin [Klebsiella pneumoniae]